jgi:FkbM family methyltransferase
MLTKPMLFAKKIAIRFRLIYKLYILRDELALELKRWFKNRGDETLRLDYPELNENSVVFDLGGYKGDFAQAINEKYGCTVYLFEPHPNFYESCVKRFEANHKVISLNYGLSDKDGRFILSDNVNGSSFSNLNHQDKNGILCEVKEIFQTLDILSVSEIDLMKINIEGGEYSVLLHMINEGKLSLVTNYQIQFHNFVSDARYLRNKITEALTKTHKRTWCYTFVWENWRKK